MCKQSRYRTESINAGSAGLGLEVAGWMLAESMGDVGVDSVA